MSSLATPGSYPHALPKETSVSQFTPLWAPYNTAGVGPTGPAGASGGATGPSGSSGPAGVSGSNVAGVQGATGTSGSAYGFGTLIYSNTAAVPLGTSFPIATSTWPAGPYILSVVNSSGRNFQQTNLTAPFVKTTGGGIRGGGSVYAQNIGGIWASANNADTVQPTKMQICNNTSSCNVNFTFLVYQAGLN